MTPPDPQARFLVAIGQAATSLLGRDHPLALAVEDVGNDPTPAKAGAAHDLLATLPGPEHDRVVAEAHRIMREDLAAIWAFLPGAAQSGGLH